MTTEPTVHDRIMQAVLRDAELLDKLLKLQEDRLAMKQAEDSVRKDPTFNETVARLTGQSDEATGDARAVFDATVSKAKILFDKAKAIFDRATNEAQAVLNQIKDMAEMKCRTETAQATQARDLKLAEARAMVHRTELEIAALRTTIDQHRRNIQERLGINLGNLKG